MATNQSHTSLKKKRAFHELMLELLPLFRASSELGAVHTSGKERALLYQLVKKIDAACVLSRVHSTEFKEEFDYIVGFESGRIEKVKE